jgi:uncharacterized membrane protein YczE
MTKSGGFADYFLDLEFFPDKIDFGELKGTRLRWTLSAYGLLALGLFCQQLIDLRQIPITVKLENVHWGVFIASLVVAVALLPPFMRWLNKRHKNPSFIHVLWAFTVGFFVNLSTNIFASAIAKYLGRL